MPEHGPGLAGIDRLAQAVPIQNHSRVGTQHGLAGVAIGHMQRFLACDAQHVRLGGFAVAARFVDIGRVYVKSQAELAQQFAPSRRSGCQDQGQG